MTTFYSHNFYLVGFACICLAFYYLRCWVYKPWNRVSDLPAHKSGIQPYDYEANNATARDFPEKLDEAPMFWAAWVYKPLYLKPWWLKNDIAFLFGEKHSMGRIHVFPNTNFYRDILWRVKSLIEVKSVKFPDGLPDESDIPYMQVDFDGICHIKKSLVTESSEAISDDHHTNDPKIGYSGGMKVLLESPEKLCEQNNEVSTKRMNKKVNVMHRLHAYPFEDNTWIGTNKKYSSL